MIAKSIKDFPIVLFNDTPLLLAPLCIQYITYLLYDVRLLVM